MTVTLLMFFFLCYKKKELGIQQKKKHITVLYCRIFKPSHYQCAYMFCLCVSSTSIQLSPFVWILQVCSLGWCCVQCPSSATLTGPAGCVPVSQPGFTQSCPWRQSPNPTTIASTPRRLSNQSRYQQANNNASYMLYLVLCKITWSCLSYGEKEHFI